MSYKVVVGDDDLRSIVFMKKFLEASDFSVVVAKNGLEILQCVKSEKPDIILLDIVMPIMNGFDVCMQLKSDSELKDIPIIMVTHQTDSNNLMRALDLGAFDYIKKPINEVEALARIKSALKYKEAQDKIKEIAMRDGLTGLYNHRFLIEIFEKEYSKRVEKNCNISYAMLDLDHFKKINDTYGHIFGDEVLKKIADIITESIREGDTVGRYGGEEFGVVIPDSEPEEVINICEKIRTNIENHFYNIGGSKFNLTASIGIYLCKAIPDINFKEVIKVSDEALYEAKSKGRNRIELRILN